MTVDTRDITAYSPLIPAIEAMCKAAPGERMRIVMNNMEAFNALKDFLAAKEIGFREIYDGDRMEVQFTVGQE